MVDQLPKNSREIEDNGSINFIIGPFEVYDALDRVIKEELVQEGHPKIFRV